MAVVTPTQEIDDDDDHNSIGSSWSCNTNWTITEGSIESSLTFESSDSPPIDSESTTTPNSPLILQPPSPDSGTCEIKLCFMQKHEIRQVYIRSTARVYEIYYACSLQSENEYLCTVRCSIAERDEELCQASAVEEVAQKHMECSAISPAEGNKVTSEAKLCTNEDDWVDVKVPVSACPDNGISCLQKSTVANVGRHIEDLYEATAQISDADSCMSLTIRMLSLQNRSSLCIDEIYIFGDPVDSNDTENQIGPVENQASSFMAMLVPTLLQMSNSGISQKQDKHVLDRQRKEDNEVGIAAKPAIISSSTNATEDNDQEKKFSDKKMQLNVTPKPTEESAYSQPPNHQNLNVQNLSVSTLNSDVPRGHIERALEQLLDRVIRIEDMCLRFEENMVKPMNNMEMRLQRVEQQLENLTKNSKCSGGVPCSRITAPSFTYSESNSSSKYTSGSDYQPCVASVLEKKDLPCNKLFNPSDDVAISSNHSHILPSLVIAAPEFSCGEDEEENKVMEPVENSSQIMQKQVLSIDDALAAALSGFLSTYSVHPADTEIVEVTASGTTSEIVNDKKEPSECAENVTAIGVDCTFEEYHNDKSSKYTKILSVVAPEFTAEDCDFEHPSMVQGPSAIAAEDGSEESGKDVVSSPSIRSLEPEAFSELDRSKTMHNSSPSSATSEPYAEEEIVFLKNLNLEETSGSVYSSLGDGVGCPSDQGVKVAEDTKLRHPTNEPQVDILASITKAESDDCASIMQNMSEYSRPSALDFDIPILDVKFAASEHSNTKFSLEALLSNTEQQDIGAPSAIEQADNTVNGEESTIIAIDDEPNRSTANINLLVDYIICSADALLSSGDGPNNPCIPDNQEVFVGLI